MARCCARWRCADSSGRFAHDSFLEAYFTELWRSLGPEPTCKCCGVKLTMSRKRMRRTRHPCNVSPDRIDRKLGYVNDNVQLICVECNLLRGGTSLAKAQEHVERLREVGGKFSIADGARCLKPG